MYCMYACMYDIGHVCVVIGMGIGYRLGSLKKSFPWVRARARTRIRAKPRKSRVAFY